MRIENILEHTRHRPYPPPRGAWAISMSWHDLLFMHWPVPQDALRPLIPQPLELDTFDGAAWIGAVPFRMTGVRPRFVPGIAPLSDFPEINLRTYVTYGGRPGVWFFSLDAHNPLAVRMARAAFGLPYFDARISCGNEDGWVRYSSVRTHRHAPPACFEGRYRPAGELLSSRPGSLENFLTERYCLYTADSRGQVRRGEIHHVMWPLQEAEAEVDTLEMIGQIGLTLPASEPLLHFSRRLDVYAWLTRRI